ncbi:MAG: hypothetical protein JXA19_03750 [Anaerolineales bacterium]|nr:hypothetical protein [Anaerolineales bacterium]
MEIILWYILISILGLITLPLCQKFFGGLADKGYIYSRTVGLFLWGFIFWLLNSLGVLSNTVGGLITALVVLIITSYLILRQISFQEIRMYFQTHKRLILAIEIMFLLSFAGMVYFRALYPDIVGTEKPMELAFINSIVRSESMPPADPWLSGYSISYYYFGFLLVGMMAKMTATIGGVAFNLGIALVFALTAINTTGVVYNLLASRRPSGYITNVRLASLGFIFVLLVGNAESFLEIMHARHAFWQESPLGEMQSGFWEWLDIEDLRDAPIGEPGFAPRTFGTSSWCSWCWRASRVIQDYDMAGNDREIIDEFPAFSFELGDLHPHVLALPFTSTAIALALSVFLDREEKKKIKLPWGEIELSIIEIVFYAILMGGFLYINFWDFPVYIGFLAASYMLKQVYTQGGWSWDRLYEFLTFGMLLGILALVIYLPFILSFSSQAGGIIANVIFVTRGVQFWVMFGPLLIPIFGYLFYLWISRGTSNQILKGLLTGFGIIAFGFLFSIGLAVLIVGLVPSLTKLNPLAIEAGNAFLGIFAAPDLKSLLSAGLAKRITQPGTWITIGLLLSLGWGLFYNKVKSPSKERIMNIPVLGFFILLTIFGALTTLLPDFVYLRDLFGYRINSVFKFYYQGWMFWGLAAATASALFLCSSRKWLSFAYSIVLVVVLLVGVTFSVYAIADRMIVYDRYQQPLSLDGTRNYAYLNDQDRAAVNWLSNAPYGVVAEAVGGSYSQYARISTHTGLPTVLGWEFHEMQWRGGVEEMAGRNADIRLLYETNSPEVMEEIINRYDIRYIYLGSLERNTYSVSEGKFETNLKPVFILDEVIVYSTAP